MTLWSGRFSEAPAAILWRYTVDPADRRLLPFDIEGSMAHAAMLASVGLLSAEEDDTLQRALAVILDEARAGTFRFLDSDEDVHSAVERRLVEMAGELGERLHAARSRNDQVALDLHLYLRRACARQAELLASFARALVGQARRHSGTVVAAYTHLQQAQAVPLGYHLLAHAWMAVRNRERFLSLAGRLTLSPLGAGAGAGSALPVDPEVAARNLGFEGVVPNSMDAVGSRDLVAEFVWCCAQTMVDLSRLAEEVVLWTTAEFGWATLPDALSTGSSALPHKKNPDVAELARGRAAGAIADLVAVLALQKGLPLSYNRDLQEDKGHVFSADDVLSGTLEAITALVVELELHPPEPGPWVTAGDLVEALVARGVPFRQAHRSVGALVTALIAQGRHLGEATAEDLVAADPRFTEDDLGLLDPKSSVARRTTPGSGSTESVNRQADALDALLNESGTGQGESSS